MKETGRSSGPLLAGAVLAAAGLVMLLDRPASLSSLSGLWPIFMVAGGVARVLMFVAVGKPRSPFGGLLLAAVGSILILDRFALGNGLLAFHGRYWLLFLGLYSIAQILRHHFGSDPDDINRALLSARNVLMVALIAGTGIACNRYGSRDITARTIPGQARVESYAASGGSSAVRIGR